MSQSAPKNIPAEEATDGRRLRTKRNRDKVIKAMLSIVKEGNLTPNAEDVASRAGVGIRSVFRYFDDMESLIHEMIIMVEKEVLPIAGRPIKSEKLEDRIDEIIDLRVEFFEYAMPFKLAAAEKRNKSEKLMECYVRDLALLRQWLADALPKEIVKNEILFEAIDAALSFDVWRRLRQEQKLDAQKGRSVVKKMITGILKDTAE